MHDEKHLDGGQEVSLGLLDQGVYAKEIHRTTVELAPALTINENQVNVLERIEQVIKGI